MTNLTHFGITCCCCGICLQLSFQVFSVYYVTFSFGIIGSCLVDSKILRSFFYSHILFLLDIVY